jgi:hypothetical protein
MPSATLGQRAALVIAVAVLAPITTVLLSADAASRAGHTSSRFHTASSDHTTRRPLHARARHPTASGSAPMRPPARVLTPHETLAAAISRALRGDDSSLAVGVENLTSGVTATYHGDQAFDTASIVKADILAVLQLHHQRTGTDLSPGEQGLATEMIEDSDNDAATALWDDDEGADGMEAGDATLGLHGTDPDADGAWGLTTTTVTDQLRLLADLATNRSPLATSARQYELGLMRNVVAWQSWGVSAAADAGTRPAVKNGWLPLSSEGGLWEINSIGVISHAGQQFLVAVLSSGHSSESAGIHVVQAAAKAAVSAATGFQRPQAKQYPKNRMR